MCMFDFDIINKPIWKHIQMFEINYLTIFVVATIHMLHNTIIIIYLDMRSAFGFVFQISKEL